MTAQVRPGNLAIGLPAAVGQAPAFRSRASSTRSLQQPMTRHAAASPSSNKPCAGQECLIDVDPVPHGSDGRNRRHRNSAQEGDQLGDRGDPEDLDPFDQLRLSRLAAAARSPAGTLPAEPRGWLAGCRVRAGDDHPTRVHLAKLFGVAARRRRLPVRPTLPRRSPNQMAR